MTEAPRAEAGAGLDLRGLTVERGGRAVVRDVTIAIPAGEVTALLGPNGAGKSSLVLAVGGVLRPQAGSVLLDGRDFAGRRPELIRRAGIAIVPEGRRLLSELTVEDNIGIATYALAREQARAGRKRALDLFPELSRRLSARARTLSGGEQQMLVLAQALVSQPRYIRDRGAADRAVRDRRPRAGQSRLRHGGRPAAVLRAGRGAARPAGAAPVGVPAARQRGLCRAAGRSLGACLWMRRAGL